MARLLGFFDLTLSAFMNRVKALHARVTLARLEYWHSPNSVDKLKPQFGVSRPYGA
jgi:hypothetical protein